MAVETEQGDILAADVDALVNPVNVVGVMGKGLALQFKKAFPENFMAYAEACKSGEIKPGKVHIFERLVSPSSSSTFRPRSTGASLRSSNTFAMD